jgi:diguanylate cyclase (GGDEF)-like protein
MNGDGPKGRSFERLAVLPPYVMMLVCMVGYVALAMVLAAPAAHALGWSGATLKYALLCLAFATPLLGFGVVLPTKLHVIYDTSISAEREEELRAESARQEFEAKLHRALETAEREDGALTVVGRAFEQAGDATAAELMLADSSRAHLRVAVERGPGPDGHGPRCGVDSPWSCPAVRRGHAVTYEHSGGLDACPRLWERAVPCQAVCVPITVMGRAIGVLHATRPVEDPMSDAEVARLDTIAQQAGSRIALLRAMERSQLQAATDPLTGLLNRRTLEERARALVGGSEPFAVVMADLDHFKTVNDTFGHDAGDRALRLFSRVLTSSLRPEDVVSRYGGEEFVVLLPGCSADDGVRAMERLRENLALAVSSGSVPSFTCSVGVTDSTVGRSLSELVDVADAALLSAKRSGRNRIVVDTTGAATPAAYVPE